MRSLEVGDIHDEWNVWLCYADKTSYDADYVDLFLVCQHVCVVVFTANNAVIYSVGRLQRK